MKAKTPMSSYVNPRSPQFQHVQPVTFTADEVQQEQARRGLPQACCEGGIPRRKDGKLRNDEGVLMRLNASVAATTVNR